MDLKYAGLLPSDIYEEKADRICELYAMLIRMTAPRAMTLRYAFPCVERVWPMFGQSTAEHAFMMAQMIHPIYLEFLDVFLVKDFAPGRLESEALHHDDAEALTGDVATNVDGVTRFMKDAAEAASIEQLYWGLACRDYMRERQEIYEARETYLSKLVKMLDTLELVMFTQYCVRNGVGVVRRGANGGYVLKSFDEWVPTDLRTYGEIGDFFAKYDRAEATLAEIFYDHGLSRVESLGRPELTGLFKLISGRAFEFPFENYSLDKMPMELAK